jgi:hypothetical protein
MILIDLRFSFHDNSQLERGAKKVFSRLQKEISSFGLRKNFSFHGGRFGPLDGGTYCDCLVRKLTIKGQLKKKMCLFWWKNIFIKDE